MTKIIRDKRTARQLEITFDGVKSYFRPGLFYDFPIALRFSLQSEKDDTRNPIIRMIAALKKTEILFNAVFAKSKKATIMIHCITPHRSKSNSSYATGLRDLMDRCQFDMSSIKSIAWRNEKYDYGSANAMINIYTISMEPKFDRILPIFWAAIGKDLGIEPHAAISAYVIDFSKGIVLHPYDDRGLDIIAKKKMAIQGMYTKYYKFLLKSDIAKMKDTFSVM